jgi:hypothetical protein
MFWPVRWFGLLMIVLWCGAYRPEEWLERALDRLSPAGASVGAPTIGKTSGTKARKRRREVET